MDVMDVSSGWAAAAVAVVAVGVSVYVAWLTKRMADVAEAAATTAKVATEAALTSAQHARRAADAAVADLSVVFKLRGHQGFGDVEGEWVRVLECTVVNEGVTVWVHALDLIGARPLLRSWDEPGGLPEFGRELLLVADGQPQRLHRGELAVFPTGYVMRQGDVVEYLDGSVLYSLDGASEPTGRRVHYNIPPADEQDEDAGR